MTYKCEHFKIQELVSQKLYSMVHEDILWQMFDENLLRGIDWLRDQFGPITINNWHSGGSFKQSGLRTKNSKYYSSLSMHSVGQAADLKFADWTPKQVSEKLRQFSVVPYIMRIENGTTTWLHVDTKPIGQAGLYFFNP